jgi:hypothetical protein
MPVMIPSEFQIGPHSVTEVTRETAKVGCTKVTRTDVEKLLKQMDAAPKEFDFEIEPELSGGEYINFNIRHHGGGWIAASEDSKAQRTGFRHCSAFFCLDKQKATKLLDFLSTQLGKSQKYIIEYYEGDGKWRRSSNVRTHGEFSTLREASAAAANEETTIGNPYRYRAVPA